MVFQSETHCILHRINCGPKIHQSGKGFRCRTCHVVCANRNELFIHQQLTHLQAGAGELKEPPWGEEQPPWVSHDGHVNQQLKTVFLAAKRFILAKDSTDTIPKIYNVPVNNDISLDGIMSAVREIYEKENTAFKINFNFGYIFKNKNPSPHPFRYHQPYYNSPYLKHPFLISNRSDIARLRRELEKIELISKVLNDRPNTEWKLHFIPNLNFFVWPLVYYSLGKGDVPNFIMNHSSIRALVNNKNGRPFKDNLCFFRALDMFKTTKFTKSTIALLFREWVAYRKSNGLRDISMKNFQGIALDEIPHLEICFKVSINVFQLAENGNVLPLFKTRAEYEGVMNLNLYGCHLSLITNLSTYAKKFECLNCHKLHTSHYACLRHSRTCKNAINFKFLGGFYCSKDDIFKELEEFGIVAKDRFYPYFQCFDFESYLKPIDEFTEGGKLRYNYENVPVSVSVCSNVEGQDKPLCIVDADPSNLVQRMLEYMSVIQTKSSELAKQRWQWVFEELAKQKLVWIPPTEEKEEEEETSGACFETDFCEPPSKRFKAAISLPNTFRRMQERLHRDNTLDVEYNDWDALEEQLDEEDEEIESDEEILPDDLTLPPSQMEEVSVNIRKMMYRKLQRMERKFELYINQLPSIGYNSSRYDLPLIKSYFAEHLKLHLGNNFIIKKNNAYNCISTNKFKFLDITQYLSPGTSYAKFLKAFKVKSPKEFFPYQWFTSIEKLDEVSLPEFECEDSQDPWYSDLKGGSVLNDGEKSAAENFEHAKQIWREQNMQTFKDYLIMYNNADTAPFCEGVEKVLAFYQGMGVDLFKVSISNPGVARSVLFDTAKNAGASISLIDKENKDLHAKISANIVGGQSIIFTRYAKAGVTPVRLNSDEMCEKVVGYDANALYLYALSKEMPCESFFRRKLENNFIPESNVKYLSMFHWMNFLNCQGHTIKHKMNSSREKRVGPYLLDGYCAITNTAYEFMGCYFHSHTCEITANIRNENWLKRKEKTYQNTLNKIEFLKRMGMTVEVMWECEFNQLKKNSSELRDFIATQAPKFVQKFPRSVSEEAILHHVVSGELYGMVECSIEVPEVWQGDFKAHLPPQQYFSEMSPLFCNATVEFKDFGETMQNYIINEFGKECAPKRLLVGGMRAKKILLATPLLAWYLKHGMRVTEIFEVRFAE